MINLILGVLNVFLAFVNFNLGNYGVAAFVAFAAGWSIRASMDGGR